MWVNNRKKHRQNSFVYNLFPWNIFSANILLFFAKLKCNSWWLTRFTQESAKYLCARVVCDGYQNGVADRSKKQMEWKINSEKWILCHFGHWKVVSWHKLACFFLRVCGCCYFFWCCRMMLLLIIVRTIIFRSSFPPCKRTFSHLSLAAGEHTNRSSCD